MYGLLAAVVAMSAGAGRMYDDAPSYRGSKREQTEEEKQAAIDAAEEKRLRKAAKRLKDRKTQGPTPSE